MNLLSTSEKITIMSAFEDLHDTFGRSINIYKLESGTTAVVTNPSNNALYGGNANAKRSDPVLKSFSKIARIRYSPDQSMTNGSTTDAQTNISWPLGSVRLKVDAETLALIQDSQKIEVDGHLCEIVSDQSEIGPFDPQYKTVYLKRIN